MAKNNKGMLIKRPTAYIKGSACCQ